MQSLLLATDGSPSAAEATRKAIELARDLRAPLTVVSIAQDNLSIFGYGFSSIELAEDLHLIQQKHISDVFAAVRDLADPAGVALTTLSLEGVPGARICEAAEENDVRLIVVGAHGWGRRGRVIHGSGSEYVFHHARVPVLVVAERPTEHPDAATETVGAAST